MEQELHSRQDAERILGIFVLLRLELDILNREQALERGVWWNCVRQRLPRHLARLDQRDRDLRRRGSGLFFLLAASGEDRGNDSDRN